MTWTVILDMVMAALLMGSIGTTIVLDRRLRSLRGDNAQLRQLTDDFLEATGRADQGVNGLKVSAQVLQTRIEAARSLADDLQFLIERGNGTADRLEADVRSVRRPEPRGQVSASAGGQVAGRGAGRSGSRGTATAAPRSAAELNLIAAMRAHG